MKPSISLQTVVYVQTSRSAARWSDKKLADLNARNGANLIDRHAALVAARDRIALAVLCISLCLGTVGVALIVKYGWALVALFTR